jgi:hypothetical protein
MSFWEDCGCRWLRDDSPCPLVSCPQCSCWSQDLGLWRPQYTFRWSQGSPGKEVSDDTLSCWTWRCNSSSLQKPLKYFCLHNHSVILWTHGLVDVQSSNRIIISLSRENPCNLRSGYKPESMDNIAIGLGLSSHCGGAWSRSTGMFPCASESWCHYLLSRSWWRECRRMCWTYKEKSIVTVPGPNPAGICQIWKAIRIISSPLYAVS